MESKIEITTVTSDHDKEMAIKLIKLLDDQDLSIVDDVNDHYLWEQREADIERLGRILRELFA